ncbi:MAG TPA: glycosyltransferase family 39 protein, partial [Chthonomonadales bacterium]|nr:glycosyltransferase family 39 protein [Chthonomonadales bacterium]
GYPFELEWIGGAMLDHCKRVLMHLPLYTAPGPGWFPYEYPPLYTWLCAWIMEWTGGPSFVPMRLVSILSTIGCAWLLYAWCRRACGSTIWSIAAAGLFLASYRFTGAFYDIERLDMLFLFLSFLGCYLLARSLPAEPVSASASPGTERSAGGESLWVVLAALAFALAFLTKQQAILFTAAGAAALAWGRRWVSVSLFLAVSFFACAIPVWALNSSSHGWFLYYCFRVPLSNGVHGELAYRFFEEDLPLFAPVIVLLGLSLWRSRMGNPSGGSSGAAPRQLGGQRPLIWLMTAAGLVGALISRSHWGGYENVLMTGYALLGLAAAVAAARLRLPGLLAPAYGLALAQLAALAYRPGAQLPTRAGEAAGRQMRRQIAALSRAGPVLYLDHGDFTDPPRFQIMALHDVAATEKRVPQSIETALRLRCFAAIVSDAKPDPHDDWLSRYYQPERCLHLSTTWCVTGYMSPGPDRQVWILKPKR